MPTIVAVFPPSLKPQINGRTDLTYSEMMAYDLEYVDNHPLWRDVPHHQWDDWRWQSQNAVRSVRQLREFFLRP